MREWITLVAVCVVVAGGSVAMAQSSTPQGISNYVNVQIGNNMLGVSTMSAAINGIPASISLVNPPAEAVNVATTLGNRVQQYVTALGQLVKNLELLYGDPRSLDPQSRPTYVAADSATATKYSSSFMSYINDTVSPTKLSPVVNTSSINFLLSTFASGNLLSSFISNYKQFSHLKYQYFAAEAGYIQYFPGFTWPSGYPQYDARSTNWYANSASGPKNIVLMIRKGYDYGGAIQTFLGTLSTKDFVQIVAYGANNTAGIPDCYSLLPPQIFHASLQNIQVWSDFASESAKADGSGDANLTYAFSYAFNVLQNSIENPSLPVCIPTILWLPVESLGDVADNDLRLSVESFNDRLSNTSRPAVISVYETGAYNQFSHRITCENEGLYADNLNASSLSYQLSRYYLNVAQSLRSSSLSADFVDSTQFTYGHSSFLTTTFRPDSADIPLGTILSLVQPCYSGRTFIGVMGMEFALSELEGLMEQAEAGVTGYYMVADQQGAAIFHPLLPSVEDRYPDTLVDIHNVETTPAFYQVRTGMVESTVGSRLPISVISPNSEYQRTVFTARYDWAPIKGLPFSAGVRRNLNEVQVVRLEPRDDQVFADTYLLSAYIPYLTPGLSGNLSVSYDPYFELNVTKKLATYIVPPKGFLNEDATSVPSETMADSLHYYLNNLPPYVNSYLTSRVKGDLRVFSSSRILSFWNASASTGVIGRWVVFLDGTAAIFPGPVGEPTSYDVRGESWFSRALFFAPYSNIFPGYTYITPPFMTLSPPLSPDGVLNPSVYLSIALNHVAANATAAVMALQMDYRVFWSSLLASFTNPCVYSITSVRTPSSVYCILINDATVILGDFLSTNEANSYFMEERYLYVVYPGVSKALINAGLLIEESRVDYATNVQSSSYYLNHFSLIKLPNMTYTGPLNAGCASAQAFSIAPVPKTGFYLVTMTVDYFDICSIPIPAASTNFTVDVCEEAKFDYAAPMSSENCPYPVLYLPEVVDLYRQEYAQCEGLGKYYIITYIHWSDPIAIAFVTATAVCQFLIGCLMLWVFLHESSPIIRLSSPVFCQIILLGCLLQLTTVYFLTGQPTTNICRARAWFFCLGFSMTFTALFAKTWRIHQIYRQARSFKNRPISTTTLLLNMIIAMSPTVILLALWSGINPLDGVPISDSTNSDQQILQCQCENQWVWQGLLIGVNALLVVYGIYVSIVTRKIKVPFNESKYIGLAIYNCAVLAPLGIAIGAGLEHINTAWYAVLCACIIAGVMLGVFVLFGSKLRIHYLKPEKNNFTGTSTSGGSAGGSSAGTEF